MRAFLVALLVLGAVLGTSAGAAAGPSPSLTLLGAIDFVSPTHGWIQVSSSAGYSAACWFSRHPASACNRAITGIYETRDGGRSWSRRLRLVSSPLETMGTSALPGVWMHFFDSSHGTIVAMTMSGESFYRTSNGGRSWVARPLPRSVGSVAGTDITFTDWRDLWLMAHEGAAMGSEQISVYRTWNGGDRWVMLACTPLPVTGSTGCHFRSGIDFGGHKGNLVFANPLKGFFADNNSGVPYLYVTGDGGHHWRIERPGLPRGALVLNSRTNSSRYAEYQQPVFLGSVGILPTTIKDCRPAARPRGGSYTVCSSRFYAMLSADGGRTWPVTHRIPWTGQAVATVWQVLNDRTWWSVTGTKLWSTIDGGLHWRSTPLPVPRGFSLVGIQFLRSDEGWAIAARINQKAGVVYSTLLLHTADGGAHWSKAATPGVVR